MNQRVVIVGVIGIVGVGAYFYFNSKLKKPTTEIVDNSQSLISVPPKGFVLSTPEEVVDTAKKITDAKGLARNINNSRLEKENMISNPRQYFIGKIPRILLGSKQYLDKKIAEKISAFDQQIVDMEKTLSSLGYKEVNGNIVRIV
jgi:hypothetical protein